MIVDDSRFIRKIVQEIIESDSALSVVGYATNGQDALAKIEEIKPDLILLDWDMPVMKGSTALMHIMIKTPCPVIILSSFAGGVGVNPIDLLCLGGVDFLRKPQNNWRLDGRADDLVRRVKEASSIKFGRIRRVKVPPQVNRNHDSGNDSRPAQFLTILASSVGGSADLIRLIPFLAGRASFRGDRSARYATGGAARVYRLLGKAQPNRSSTIKAGELVVSGRLLCPPGRGTYRTRKRGEPYSCSKPVGPLNLRLWMICFFRHPRF